MRHFIILTIIILAPLAGFSTHIVGGALTYEHLGGATYRIKLKLYRDCDPSSADFDNNAYVEVKDANGTDLFDIVMPLGYRNILQPVVDTCVVQPGICVEEGIYTLVVNNLPPRVGGYHLFYSRCCRNGSIQNITGPLNAGEQFYTYIPYNASLITNSSPEWVNFPPIFVCQNQPIAFDHQATDKDGDSLVYSLYTPFIGCSGADPAGPDCPNEPNFPGPTFNTVTWVGGFNANNPMGGGGLTIDANGFLDGTPPNIGQYVVGIRCEEWRDGQLLGFIVRDFQFNVVNCPPLATADIGPIDPCGGQTVTFVNQSDTFAVGYQWDFGDPSSTSDTSTLRDPGSWTYPGLGPYTISLIIQPNTACADTAYETAEFGTISGDFTINTDSSCVGLPFAFNDISGTSPNDSIVQWEWDFGDGGTDNINNPTYSYGDSGTYTVTMIVTSSFGCTDTVQKDVYVQKPPEADGVDTMSCSNNACVQLTGSVLNAGGGNWSGSGTFTPPSPTGLTPVYCPTAGEISNGWADLLLVTISNGLCPADTDSVRVDYTPGPTADIGIDTLTICKDSSSFCLSGTVTIATGGQWSTNGNGSFDYPDSLDACYTPDPSDFNAADVYIYLTTTGNGDCNPAVDSVRLNFIDSPSVVLAVPDTACAGLDVNVTATPSTGSGIWTTLGDGTFANNTNLNTTYTPGPLDTANRTVTLIFTSTNNGICNPVTDSIDVTILPAPVALGGGNLTSCENNACIQLNGNVYNAGDGDWLGLGVFTPGSPTGLTPVYCPTAPEINNGFTDVYLVSTLNGICPSDTDTVRINFTPPPISDIPQDTITVCKDINRVCMSANIVGAGGGKWTSGGDGSWFLNNDTSLNSCYELGPNDIAGTKVWLYLTTTYNGNCNPVADSVLLTLLDPPVVQVLADDTICANSCLQLGANSSTGGGYWTALGDGQFMGGISNPNAQYCPGPGDINIGGVSIVFTSTNNGMCQPATDTLDLVVIPGPSADFTNTEICPGDTMFFTDMTTKGVGGLMCWNWNFGDGKPGSNAQNPSHLYDLSTTFNATLVVCDSMGCTDTITKPVKVTEAPFADFTFDPGCKGDSIQFYDLSIADIGDTVTGWHWQFGDGDTSGMQNPAHIYNQQGGYIVTLTVTNSIGCTDTIQKVVNIFDRPIANFSVNPSLSKAYTPVSFTDLSTSGAGIDTWYWDFGDSSGVSGVQNPQYTYDVTGDHLIMLIITDINGCTDTAYRDIHVFTPPDIPNGFTPNGDGENDIFYIRGGPYKELELKIYNNWGELIFIGLSQADGWDGTRDGIKQPIGVYVYTAVAVTEDDERHEFKGDVTLLR